MNNLVSFAPKHLRQQRDYPKNLNKYCDNPRRGMLGTTERGGNAICNR